MTVNACTLVCNAGHIFLSPHCHEILNGAFCHILPSSLLFVIAWSFSAHCIVTSILIAISIEHHFLVPMVSVLPMLLIMSLPWKRKIPFVVLVSRFHTLCEWWCLSHRCCNLSFCSWCCVSLLSVFIVKLVLLSGAVGHACESSHSAMPMRRS